jgi:hypothetical protein
MQELLNILRAVPRPMRWLGLFFVCVPLAYVVGQALGMGQRSWILIAVLLGVFLLLWGFESLRRAKEKQRARSFEGGLGLNARQAEVGKEEIREALRELAEKWQLAVRQLREAGMSLYSLPWYLLIGEPQSGKSTTLKNSGLEFPVGADALSGAGGTRNCDWWFSNEAVILDTAGRFTFQEETAPDQHEWSTFLKLLARHRRDCPINGVIVVIPATSLVEDPADEQERKAKNIRQKLLHLQKVLAIRVPVFILITKTDRILGFTEFFSKLDPADQRQLFGWSNPGPPEEPWDLKAFSGIFDDIVTRMQKLRLRLLKDDDNVGMLDKLFVFPEELESLKEPLANYLHTVFSATRFDEPFLFRGFYLTSGVQQGRPIARACRDLLRVQVGDPQGVLEDLEQVFSKSRAFFIRDFYEKKLFPEQGLIAPTRAALKRHAAYRWVLRGASAALAALFLLAMVPAALNLYRVIQPVNDSVKRSRDCLNPPGAPGGDAGGGCDAPTALGLIHELEHEKRSLAESRWTMRALFRGGEHNEITEELVPAIQAKLFQRDVLAPLLASFAARSRSLQAHPKAYPDFFEGFRQLLRFRQLKSATRQSDVASLEAGLGIGPLVAFCRATPGADPQGRLLDGWLKTADPKATDAIFQEALATRPDLSRLEVPEAADPHAAFRDYWTLRNLARWDFVADDHFRTWQSLYGELLGLDLAGGAAAAPAGVAAAVAPGGIGAPLAAASSGPPPAATGAAGGPGAAAPAGGAATSGAPAAGAAALAPPPAGAAAGMAHVADLVQRFKDNFDQETAHLRSDRPQASGDRRPGRNADEWARNCQADYGELVRVARDLASAAEQAELCGRIPGDWTALQQGRAQYRYLYQERQDGSGAPAAWSAPAAQVEGALVTLGGLAAPQQLQKERDDFRQALDRQQGDSERTKLIQDLRGQETTRFTAPAEALAKLATAADPAFRLAEGAARARQIGELAFALRLLPPAADYFVDTFRLDCANCFLPKHADDLVPPANDLLQWARVLPQPVGGLAEVRGPAGRIDDAVYNYLAAFVDREKGSGGGGGGGGGERFAAPGSAAGARTWRDFVREIQRWEPVTTGRAPSPAAAAAGGTGLTGEALGRYASTNQRVMPLVTVFNQREHSRETAASRPAARLPEELVAAANGFKRCVAGLESDALKAWRQLALQKDGTSLADFHAFTGNLRLRGNPIAGRLAAVEAHGAALMTSEIRPLFVERSRGFWGRVAQCCTGRYPFISPRQLRRQQESYFQGYAQGAGAWVDESRDPRLREVNDTLDLQTASLDAIDRLFFEGGSLDSLFADFALDPLVDGKERIIDFIRGDRERLRVLRQWQRFLFAEKGAGAGSGQQLRIKLVDRSSPPPHVFLGERMGQVDFFGSNPLRPSTDANRVRVLTLPLTLEDRPTSVLGRNEDKDGWSGRLTLRGGPLKIPYFVHLASAGRPREAGRIWTVHLELADYQQPQTRLDGLFELTFDRPLPDVLPDEGDAP